MRTNRNYTERRADQLNDMVVKHSEYFEMFKEFI